MQAGMRERPFSIPQEGKKNYSMNIYKAGHETETTQSLRLIWKERWVKFFQPQREFVPFRDSV